eukprot:UN09549
MDYFVKKHHLLQQYLDENQLCCIECCELNCCTIINVFHIRILCCEMWVVQKRVYHTKHFLSNELF